MKKRFQEKLTNSWSKKGQFKHEFVLNPSFYSQYLVSVGITSRDMENRLAVQKSMNEKNWIAIVTPCNQQYNFGVIVYDISAQWFQHFQTIFCRKSGSFNCEA